MSSPAQTAYLDAADEALTMSVDNKGGIGLQLTGTWAGTVSFEASIDGLTFVALNMVPSNSATAASSSTGNGAWSANCAGYSIVRARMSAYTSGVAGVTLRNADASGRF
jgi:hypothetical protein